MDCIITLTSQEIHLVRDAPSFFVTTPYTKAYALPAGCAETDWTAVVFMILQRNESQ